MALISLQGESKDLTIPAGPIISWTFPLQISLLLLPSSHSACCAASENHRHAPNMGFAVMPPLPWMLLFEISIFPYFFQTCSNVFSRGPPLTTSCNTEYPQHHTCTTQTTHTTQICTHNIYMPHTHTTHTHTPYHRYTQHVQAHIQEYTHTHTHTPNPPYLALFFLLISSSSRFNVSHLGRLLTTKLTSVNMDLERAVPSQPSQANTGLL